MKFIKFLVFIAPFFANAASFEQGRLKSATCTSCHGADGLSINPSWPHLRGQNKEYLYQQMLQFKKGERKNKIMQAAVDFLSNDDLNSLAIYYSELPKRKSHLRKIQEAKNLKSQRDITGVTTPESIYFEPESKRIFISNVVGQGAEKDGNGWIGVLSPKDQYSSLQVFRSGLNAPKGMRSKNGILWVTDITVVYGISLKNGKILKKHEMKEAVFLNDVAISDKGAVYVSDTLGSKIFVIKNDGYQVFDEGPHLESPNGLLWKDGELFVAAFGLTSNWKVKVKGRIYSIDPNTKKRTYITKKPLGTLDGLEVIGDQFYVSDWRAGKVFKVDSNGKSKVVVSNLLGAADIGFFPDRNLLMVPRMAEDVVSFFKI